MPRSLKLFIGAVTALPIVLFGYLFVRFVSVFIGLVDNGGSVQPDRLRDTFHELMGIQLTTLGVIVALLGFYLWHLLSRSSRCRSIGSQTSGARLATDRAARN